MVCFLCFQAQATRAQRILALIPSNNAISEDEEYHSSEEIPLPNENNDTESFYESSDAPSLDSSLENLRILSDSDTNEVIKAVDSSLETHVLQQNFPSPTCLHIQENDDSLRKQVLKKPFEPSTHLPSPISPSPEFFGSLETSTPRMITSESPIPSPITSALTNSPETSKFTRSKKQNVLKKNMNAIRNRKLIRKNLLVFA